MEIPINYLAVLAAAVSNMVLGFLWYGPLFGKTWSKLMGWGEMTPEKMNVGYYLAAMLVMGAILGGWTA